MPYTHALATNQFGVAAFIVDATAANGTHTTIASALSQAVSGQTIFIKPGTYVENLTLVAGVNLTAYNGDGFSATVNIVGKCTFTTAGFVMLSGIRLTTNSDFCLAVTGSAGSVIYLIDCYLNCSNNTGISFTSSSASSSIKLNNCEVNAGGANAIFSSAASGILTFSYCNLTNTAATTVASNTSGSTVFNYCQVSSALTTSSSGAVQCLYTNIDTSALNTTCLTLVGTGISFGYHSNFNSGTASAISIGTGTTAQIHYCFFNSSNASTITGIGTLSFTSLTANSTLSIDAGLTLSNSAMKSFQSLGGVGTSGQVWTSNGVSTAPSFQSATAGSGNLVKISSQTASNSSSIVFTSGISGTYTDYILVCKNVVPITNAVSCRLRISTDGGSTYVATGYNSAASAQAQTSTTEFMLGLGAFFSNSGSPMCGYHYLFNMTTGTGNPQHVGTLNWPQSNTSGNANNFSVGGWAPASSTVNALQITMSSGNISAGTFILYGIVP